MLILYNLNFYLNNKDYQRCAYVEIMPFLFLISFTDEKSKKLVQKMILVSLQFFYNK